MPLDDVFTACRIGIIALVAWVVWERRHTWRLRWESGITLQLVLQAAGLALCAPGLTLVSGRALHSLTGQHHLDDFLGHVCYLLAAAVIAANMVARVADDDDEANLIVRKTITPVLSLAVPLMLAAHIKSGAPLDEYLDMTAVPPDWWLRLYWIVYCAATAALLLLGIWALGIIADDKSQRQMARVWRCGLWCGVCAAAATLVNGLSDWSFGERLWLGAYLLAGIVAVLAVRSWRRRMRPYRGLLTATRTTQRELRADTVEAHRLRVGALAKAPQRHDGHTAS
ncbi:hypothetical protein MILLY_45 [Mycobacterium phage Milly]|uniref:hypothetical protein n=1 Tax=Mycobacterium phage Milly TaxID=1567473 RepID=UPI000572A97A|nr:hypothetical protein MILLY_45 [Mycobacterium phage Milly]AJA43718.1 hypothetical protein MILLY_45 [Mycobacterium phage Milly]